VVSDRAGNLWAWWGDPDAEPGVVLGSHLDSVPEGGAYDGPLGVVSALLAVESVGPLRKPVAVVCFADEEGARFGTACAGSRLLTGALAPEKALGLKDADGVTMAEARGDVPAADPEALRRIDCFVELHVEQGRALEVPVGLATEIWPHGRWRFDLRGQANHAGTTRLEDRDDPVLAFASLALRARATAEDLGMLATFGKLQVSPNAVNAVPGEVRAWLDARAPSEQLLQRLLDDLGGSPQQESWTSAVRFDRALADRLSGCLSDVPRLPTGAGHDAGVLQEHGIPTAMLFVRNPTGISHAPEEHAELDDCLAGVAALEAVLRELAG
jgi:N-carbamoyl-L-amino-acid hydrolase